MKFKTIAAATLAVATMLGMGACGSSTSAKDDKTITFWHNATAGDGKQYWEDLAKAFEKKTGVKVQIQAIQNEDFEGKLTTAMQDPASGPDVYMALGGAKTKDMIDAGQAMDLTDKISDTVKTQMKSSLKSITYDGKVYGVPVTVQPGGIWYSKDLFKQAGIDVAPTTFSELKTDVQKLRSAGIEPIALGGKDAWPAGHWYYWLSLRECSPKAYAKGVNDKDFSDSCWTKAGDDLKDLLDSNAFNEGFLTTTAQQGASSSTGFSVNPEAPDAAVDFVNFMAEKSNQEKYATAFSTIPASVEAYGAVTDENLKDIIDAMNKSDDMQLWMDTALGGNIGNALNSGVVNLLSGQGTSADIVKAMKDAASKG